MGLNEGQQISSDSQAPPQRATNFCHRGPALLQYNTTFGMKSGSDAFATTQTASPSEAPRGAEPGPPASTAPVEDVGSLETQLRNPKRYWIRGEYGRGAIGCVSRAHDRELGRDVAIKELISRCALNERRFMREALITARLQHPCIVPVYEAGRWPDGTPFYAMKLVAGRSLRDLLAERKTVDERIPLLHHVIAVADAIAYAHNRNIIHRDLKPANVVVGDFGETVVIDWGLAKELTVDEEPSASDGPVRITRDDDLTTTGSVIGTPAYMPPEQQRGEPVDQRADVFAIGAMLWELCALQRTPPASATQRRRVLRRAGIDRDLIAIIDKALDPDPAGCYADAGALAIDLKAFRSGARVGARSYSLYAMLAHWTARHRALALSVTTAIVLAVSGTVMYVRNIAAERDRALLLEAARLRAEASDRKNRELVAQSYADAGRQFLVDHRYQEAVAYLLAARQSGTVSASAPLGTMFWEVEQYLPLISLEHQDKVMSAAFSPDGTRVVTASSDKTARVWDVATGKPLTRPLEHQGRVWSAAFSPDGTRVVTASDDKTARVWDVATGKPLTRPLEHQALVMSAAFSPDGTRVVTASYDHTARVWDAATGEPLTRPLEHQGWVWSAAFSPDGTRVVTASYDHTARV